MVDQDRPAFDVAKVEEKLKNVKCLSDLTGPGGVFQEMVKETVERILKAEQGTSSFRPVRAVSTFCTRPA